MNSTLNIYLAKRVSARYFLSLAIWMFLFSVPLGLTDLFSLLDIIKVVLVLIVLHMYDDLMQCEDNALDKLKFPVLFFFALSVLTWVSNSIELASLWIYFFALNHILYKALSHRAFWSFVLPLLPFPMTLCALVYIYFPDAQFDLDLIFSMIAVILSLVVFESLNEYSEQRPSVLIYFVAIATIAIIVSTHLGVYSFIAGITALILSMLMLFFNWRHANVWFMIVMLILRMVAINFGV